MVDPPRRWEFAGTAQEGGRARIVYTLAPAGTGTHFERDLTYRGPNLLFALVDAAWIRGVMEKESAEAMARLKRSAEKWAATF
jgi:polyketide cyclase/dehydrase/lipid transport protein